MSERLETRAEILKIARLLEEEPGAFGYLEAVPAAELRILREQLTESLFDAQNQVLGRLAASSRLLPVSLVASMSERVFGPMLSARVAGLMEPERAVEISTRLPIPFLADIACELDPRRAADVLAGVPAEQVAAVSRELTRRGEYVTMGRFVAHLPPASLAAAVEQMDAETLVQVALVLEDRRRLPELVDLFDADRQEELFRAGERSDSAEEAAELLEHLTAAQREAITRGRI